MFNSAWLGTTEKLALVLSWTKFIRLLFFVLPFLGAGVEPFEGCGGWIGIDEFVSEIYYLKVNFLLSTLLQNCFLYWDRGNGGVPPLLDAALLCSSKEGSDLGLETYWLRSFVNRIFYIIVVKNDLEKTL